MTAPQNTTAPEGQPSNGQPDEDADDARAQEALAAAAPEAGDEEGDDDADLDPKVKAKIEKLNRESRALRQRLLEQEPLVKAAKDREEADKTESQRLADQLAAKDKELSELRVASVRRDAAEAAGLPVKFAKFITATDADDALDQARELAAGLKPDEPQRGPDLRQGQRGAPARGEVSRDDLIRHLAGR